MPKSRLLIFSIPLILILLVIAAYRYGYQGVQAELASIKQEQAGKMKTLVRYMALYAEKPGLEKQLAALKEARKAENSKLMVGETPSIVAAALQETVTGMITGRGGSISSQRVLKPETLDKFMVVSVSMDASLPDVHVLADVLYSIESRIPYLVVKEVDVRVKNFREPKELAVKLDVSTLTSGR